MHRKWTVAAALACLAAATPARARDPQIGRILQPQDVPAESSAVLRLTIGENGRTTGCAVERGSGSEAADTAACRHFLRHGRWRGRRDAQGRRIAYAESMEVFREFLDRVTAGN